MYPATYNFKDEVDGTTGTDIDFIDVDGSGADCVASIIAVLDGHRKVLQLHDNSNPNYIQVKHTLTSTQASGTIEFWVATSDNTKRGTLDLYDSTPTRLMRFYFENDGKLYFYVGGAATELCSLTNNILVHIRLLFDTATDKASVWVNGTLIINDQAFNNVGNALNQFIFQTWTTDTGYYLYFDAFGFSWDADYAIGDNLKGELFQCWNVKPKKHVDAINWVMLLGGIVNGVQISAESKDQNSIDELGAKIYKDTYAIYTVAAQLLIAANNLRTREQLLPLAINLWSHETNRGLIQVGECAWVAHHKGNPNISPRQIILNKVIYRFLSGHVNLQTTDGISFIKNRDESLPQENSQLIQQNATEIEVVDDKVDALSIPTIDLLAWGTLTAMTNDGAYYDIDLSGTYGANILGVMIYITTLDADITESVILRPKASTYTVIHNHNIANLSCTGTYFVHTNSDGIFQYRAMAGLTSAYYRILMVIKE